MLDEAEMYAGPTVFQKMLPIAYKLSLVKGYDCKDERTFYEPSVIIEPVVNPLLDAYLLKQGATRRGKRTYVFGVGEKSPTRPIQAAFAAIPPEIIWHHTYADEGEKKGFQNYSAWGRENKIIGDLSASPIAKRRLDVARLTQPLKHRAHPSMPTSPFTYTAALISVTNTVMNLKICTNWNDKRALRFHEEGPDLHRYTTGTRLDGVPTTPDRALRTLEVMARMGYEIIDEDGLVPVFQAALPQIIIAQRMPGSPGLSRLVVGENIRRVPGVRLQNDRIARSVEVNAKSAGDIISRARTRGLIAVADPYVDDIGAMAVSKPTQIAGMRPYQNEAIGLHLSTGVGYVNACAPGLGKTVMTIEAFKEKAAKTKNYRALVVVPAAIRTQWSHECEKFFPDASVRVFHAKKFDTDFPAWLKDAGKEPAIAVVSYDTMRRGLEELKKIAWHDLALDEAAFLKSSSQRTEAAWELRPHAKTAIALTGTPIERSLDDMAKIIAWVRGDRNLFHSNRLAKRFDVTVPGHTDKLWEALGPVVFRRDRSEISNELPAMTTETVILDPEPAELRLADAARRELKKIYDDLVDKLSIAEQKDPNDPDLKALREELQSVRGSLLGGVTLARMAASDPAAVDASTSPGAALLKAAGHVAPAVKVGGTKRRQIAGLTVDLVSRDEAVLIFTDFSSCCENLADDLRKEGLRVGTFTGDTSHKKREESVEAFQKGDLDVMVLTGAAREGLNLQRATVLIHYDLPWVPTQVVQRVGRASRIGATGDHLSVLIPIMAGTIEERVAAVLIPRAITAMAALDMHRGVEATQTEIGLALRGLDKAVNNESMEGNERLMDIAHAILGD